MMIKVVIGLLCLLDKCLVLLLLLFYLIVVPPLKLTECLVHLFHHIIFLSLQLLLGVIINKQVVPIISILVQQVHIDVR